MLGLVALMPRCLLRARAGGRGGGREPPQSQRWRARRAPVCVAAPAHTRTHARARGRVGLRGCVHVAAGRAGRLGGGAGAADEDSGPGQVRRGGAGCAAGCCTHQRVLGPARWARCLRFGAGCNSSGLLCILGWLGAVWRPRRRAAEGLGPCCARRGAGVQRQPTTTGGCSGGQFGGAGAQWGCAPGGGRPHALQLGQGQGTCWRWCLAWRMCAALPQPWP